MPLMPRAAAHSIDGAVSITCHSGGCGRCSGRGVTDIFVIIPRSSANRSSGGLSGWFQRTPGCGNS